MLVSLRWLKDYVDIPISTAELADRLTMAGLEVDAVDETALPFSGVVTARIASVRPHPETEKYLICEVDEGNARHHVVCSRTDLTPGDIVPLARVGATIPGGYTVKSTNMRGIVSQGMLCSEMELELGEDSSGIMKLPKNLSPGMDLSDALDLKDTVLDIGITPNRADCLSMIGIAREVAAITNGKLRYPNITLHENEDDVHAITSVEILDPDLCPRYSARIIKNITIKPSPLWMRQRLQAVGQRAINNIVDITNFVMLEWGQPLHAFDFSFLEEGRIVVRRSKEGEKFYSLDEKERILKPGTLMICDGVKPVAIAGIMGGLNSEVVADTKTILLESAYFDSSSIRRSSRWLGMNTEAAFRFGRGINPEGVVVASNRAAQLMEELAGGTVCRGCVDAYPLKVQTAKNIRLRASRLNNILGKEINDPDIVKNLESIEMTVHKDGIDQFLVTPPPCRVDITREIDLIEEVARLYGYDNIPVTMPAVSGMSVTKDKKSLIEERLCSILYGAGYSEIITYSFISPLFADILGLEKDDEKRNLVNIRNPLSQDMSVMRTTLIYGLIETVKKNANIGRFNLRIFERGTVFIQTQEGKLPEERHYIGGLLAGLTGDELWASGIDSDFYDLKGCLERIFDDLKIYNVLFRAVCREPFLHPGKSSEIYIGERKLGYLGELHPDLIKKLDLKNTAFVFEMDINIIAEYFSGKITYQELPRFPSITRDVAFLTEQSVEADEMLRLARGFHKELLEKVNIFDIYTGKGIPDGMKSMGLRFSYRAFDRTLTDDEVNEIHSGIVKHIVDSTGAKIRGTEF